MALFKKTTLAGSMKTLARGSTWALTRNLTPSPRMVEIQLKNGESQKNPAIAKPNPTKPAEKLLTSISNPARILPSQRRSICFIR